MPLLRRPHTITLQPKQEYADGGAVTGYSWPESGTVRGQITPETARSTFDKWGVEVVNEGHCLLVNLEDQPYIAKGDLLTCGGATYQVAEGPMIWDAETTTSHAEYLIVKQQ